MKTLEDAFNEQVETNLGTMPVVEFLDLYSWQNGFESYKDMVRQGYSIGGYDEITEYYKIEIEEEN